MSRQHHDLASERAALGGAILDRECAQEVVAVLRPEHYFRDAHAVVHEALAAQLAEGKPTDTVGVRGRLEAAGKLDRVGGDELLWSLTDTIPWLENVAAHAKRVRELAAVRAALWAMQEMRSEAEEGIEDAADFLSRAEGAVARAVEGHALGAEPVRIGDAAAEVVGQLVARAEGKPFGYRTGFTKLDRQLGGMVPGELVVLGGRPGQGKTSLAMGIAMGVEQYSGLPVFVQSAEMPRDQLAARVLSAYASVPLRRMRDCDLQGGHMSELTNSARLLDSRKVWIDDSANVTVADFGRNLRRCQRKHGLAMGVVDYLQLLRPIDRHQSREQAVAEVSRTLKGLAKELRVPILALASLNRGSEREGRDYRPRMAQLRESGAIESDADAVLLLYREEEYAPTSPEQLQAGEPDNHGIAEVIIDKNRNGPTGTITLGWQEEYTRFVNLEEASYGRE